MEPFFIVDPIQKPRQMIRDVLEGLVFVEMYRFAFHGLDEALRLGVVCRTDCLGGSSIFVFG